MQRKTGQFAFFFAWLTQRGSDDRLVFGHRWISARQSTSTFIGIAVCLCACSGLPSRLDAQEVRRWPVEFRIGHFWMHADFEFASVKDLARELNKLSEEVSALLKLPPMEAAVHLVLFEQEYEYRRYMRAYFPDLPNRRAMFIQDRGPGILFAHWHVDVQQDIRHEVTHAILHQTPATIPLWLDEGLAEYFEVETENRFRGNAQISPMVQQLVNAPAPSLASLEAIEELAAFDETSYRHSWAWTHFLIHRNAQTRRLLVEHLAELRQGKSPLPLSKRLALLLPNLDQQFQDHFKSLTKVPQ